MDDEAPPAVSTPGPMMPTTLVLLPGMDGTGDLFAPLLAAIGDSIPTAVVRYPGAAPLDYTALTRLVRAALPVDRPFVILGESFSGPIAVTIASDPPPGMAGFILCASLVTRSGALKRALSRLARLVPLRTAFRLVGARKLMGRFRTPGLTDLLLTALGKVSPHVLRARIRAVLRADVTRELAAARLPSIYLEATEDWVVAQSAAESYARGAVRGRVVKFEAPHLLLQCVPQEAARAIREFMSDLQPGGVDPKLAGDSRSSGD